MRLSDAQLDDIKARNPVHALASEHVALRLGSSKYGRAGYTGPCPICSTDATKRGATKFECDAETWVCAVCQDGGDVVRLKARLVGLDPVKDFRRLVDILGGAKADEITPAVAERHGRAACKRDVPLAAMPPEYAGEIASAWRKGWNAVQRAEDGARQYRERERLRLLAWWNEAAPFAGTPVEGYLGGRGLIAPPGARLRYHASIPLFADGREVEPRLLHRGAAQLAAIYLPDLQKGTARFCGLHMTWLDPLGPKGKARVVDPDTGEVSPSKKTRGTKAGGYIDLGGDAPALRLFAGEGIETTLAAYTALVRTGRLRPGDAFRCAVDLGNLAGKALGTVPHPSEQTEQGRPRRVPGPEADLASPAMPVPDTVVDLVGLGDGDSDPFQIRHALARFKARHAREHRTVRTPLAPAGLDFNDWLGKREGERDA